MLILEFVYTYLVTAFSQVRLHNFVVSIKFVGCAFFIRKVCSVRFFRLQKFVVSYVYCKVLQCPLFSITKFVMSAFWRLQKSLVSAFFHYKSLQGALFKTIKVCSVHFLDYKNLQGALFRLQKFVVCAFQTTKICADFVQVHGEIVQCFTEVDFSPTAIHHYTLPRIEVKTYQEKQSCR